MAHAWCNVNTSLGSVKNNQIVFDSTSMKLVSYHKKFFLECGLNIVNIKFRTYLLLIQLIIDILFQTPSDSTHYPRVQQWTTFVGMRPVCARFMASAQFSGCVYIGIKAAFWRFFFKPASCGKHAIVYFKLRSVDARAICCARRPPLVDMVLIEFECVAGSDRAVRFAYHTLYIETDLDKLLLKNAQTERGVRIQGRAEEDDLIACAQPTQRLKICLC